MEQYRRRRHGSKKTFHGKYGTIDPARTIATRKARHVNDPRPRRSERPQYVARRAHDQRGGRGRRRTGCRLNLALLVVLAAALVFSVGVPVLLLTRPASAVITASPGDATILFDGSVAGTGKLDVGDVDPGSYFVQVTRRGFEPIGVTEKLDRGRLTKLHYALEPRPQTLSIITHPEGAVCTVKLEGGETIAGETPFTAEIPAGRVTVRVDREGYDPIENTYFVDAPLSLEYYLDP